MASTYSTRLRLELPGTGDQSGSWGVTLNLTLGTLLEQAIAGHAAITMADANYTLTTVNGGIFRSYEIGDLATGLGDNATIADFGIAMAF